MELPSAKRWISCSKTLSRNLVHFYFETYIARKHNRSKLLLEHRLRPSISSYGTAPFLPTHMKNVYGIKLVVVALGQ